LERQNWSAAVVRFETAYAKIEAEPALRDLQTSVDGWLQQSTRAADRERRAEKSRRFAELHDEVLFGTVLTALHPRKPGPAVAARNALQTALSLVAENDPLRRRDHQELALLDAEL